MKLWHCHDARSLRALWALEEMNLEYDLEVMPFPPRFLHEGYLDINVLGTVPYFVDGDAHMTESTAICHYLIEKYKKYEFGLRPDHAQYGQYLNWLYHSDATLTFPQTLFLRYRPLNKLNDRVNNVDFQCSICTGFHKARIMLNRYLDPYSARKARLPYRNCCRYLQQRDFSVNQDRKDLS